MTGVDLQSVVVDEVHKPESDSYDTMRQFLLDHRPAKPAPEPTKEFAKWWNDQDNGCPTLVLNTDEEFARAVWSASRSNLMRKLEYIFVHGLHVWHYRGGEWKVARRIGTHGAYNIEAEGKTLEECLDNYKLPPSD